MFWESSSLEIDTYLEKQKPYCPRSRCFGARMKFINPIELTVTVNANVFPDRLVLLSSVDSRLQTQSIRMGISRCLAGILIYILLYPTEKASIESNKRFLQTVSIKFTPSVISATNFRLMACFIKYHATEQWELWVH